MTNIQEHFYKTELETILLPTSSKGNFMVTDQNIKIVNKNASPTIYTAVKLSYKSILFNDKNQVTKLNTLYSCKG